MGKTILYTYKIALKLPLLQIASFFGIKESTKWKEYLRIDSDRVEGILKYSSEGKAIYFYKYGCITFVNFTQEEVYYIFKFLKSLYINIDFDLQSKYNESHSMEPDEEGNVSLWEEDEENFQYGRHMEDITSMVMAKSTELYKIERELSALLDESEKFIIYLQKGKLRANSSKVAKTMAKSIQFKYRSIESIKLLERPSEFNRSIMSSRIYDKMNRHYELSERYDLIKNQMDILESLSVAYSKLGSNQAEKRLLMLEIILLALFPLSHLIDFI